MAFQTKHLVCMLLLLSFSFLFVIQILQSSVVTGCNASCTKFALLNMQHEKHRKMVAYHFGEKGVGFNNGVVSRPTDSGTTTPPTTDEGELRAAPMGPDPLHHHGGGTKKPWTP